MRACTIVARNYLPQARVLATSYAEHHRGDRITVLVTDDRERQVDPSVEPFDVLHLDALVPDPSELDRRAFIYDVTELATAMKPVLLRHLLDEGGSAVLYLDPDTCVYAPLYDIAELAVEHSLVLTPHTTEPMPRDGRTPNEADIMGSGVFNLGFVSVGQGAHPFLDWWSERLRRDCVIDHRQMLFTDQRWVDLVPGYFEHHVLRDRGVNVAYWNAFQRRVELVDGAFEVDRRPLRLFHFSGFSPDRPHLLSKHQGDRPRVLLSEHPAVAALCADYARRLREAGLDAPAPVYGWEHLPGGLRADALMRRVYRRALIEAEANGTPEPPDPFDEGDPDAFRTWLTEPLGPAATPINRYLHGLWAEHDVLQQAFPRPLGRDAVPFREWLADGGAAGEDVPAELDAPAPPSGSRPQGGDGGTAGAALLLGVNVAGYFRAELGIGEAGRLVLAVLEAAGVPHATYVYDATTSRQHHAFVEHGPRGVPYDVNLLCINADQVESYLRDVGPGLREGRHTIGMWAWELEDLPESMHAGFDHVDEVWALSSFAAAAISRSTSKPVLAMPPPIVPPPVARSFDREALGVPTGRPLFLFLFDLLSVLERKNPFAVIQAFTEAFTPGEGPVLLIKTINGDQRLDQLEAVRAAAARHPDVIVIDRYVPASECAALIESADCYVSLHRSEGFGLTLGEAMALGTPVIGTRYGGNLDFMHDGNSWLVDAELVPVPAGCEPYPEGARWADPDVSMAAAHMRAVLDRPNEAEERAQRARSDVASLHSPSARAPIVQERLDEIAAERRSRVDAPGPAPLVSALDAAARPEQPPGAGHRDGWLRRLARKPS